jgi:hypothetical protein
MGDDASDETRELTQEEIHQERESAAKELWGEDTKISPIPEQEVDNEETPEGDLTKESEEEKKSEEDPWAGVNPALRTEFDNLNKTVNDYKTLPERLKQAEKRIGSLTNQLHEANKAVAEEEAKAPTQKEIDAAAESEESWEELREEFPVWADAMDKILTVERAKLDQSMATVKELQKKIESLENVQPTAEIKETIENTREELMLEIHHPGWKKTVNTPEFESWFKTQPSDVQQKASSVKAEDAIEVLDSFGEHQKNDQVSKTPAQIEKARKERLKKSQLPSSNRTRIPEKIEDEMTDAEYRKLEEKKIWEND